MVKYCPKCGNASYNSAPVCGSCGHDFGLESSNKNSGKPKFNKPANNTDSSTSENKWKRSSEKNISKDYDPVYLTDKEKYELFKSSRESDEDYQTLTTNINELKSEYTIIPTNEDKTEKDSDDEEVNLFEDVKSVFGDDDNQEEREYSLDILNKISRRSIGIFVVIILALALIVIAGGLLENNNTTHQNLTNLGPGNYTSGNVLFTYSTDWSEYNSTSGEGSQEEVSFRTEDGTVIGFSCVNNSATTLESIQKSINQTAHSLDGKIVSVDKITINGENGTDILINTTGHGYSRYICVIHDGTYYAWIINNHKSDNQYVSAVYTTEINDMIGSIRFI